MASSRRKRRSVTDELGVGAELAVQRGTLVEGHGVDDVLEHVRAAGEQGETPLVVVEDRRPGDELGHPAGERPAGRLASRGPVDRSGASSAASSE